MPAASAPALLLAATLAVPLSAVPLQRELRDWIVTCDNLRTCELKAAYDEQARTGPDHMGLGFTISRDAGPAGAPDVRLFLPDGKIASVDLRLDGKPVAAPWRTEDGELSLHGAPAVAFVRAIKDGGELTLRAGKNAQGASLKGLAAALLAADEAQGRIGTRGALARPGPAADSSVSPAPPEPIVVSASKPPPLAGGPALAAAVRRARAADLKREDCNTDELKPDDSAEPFTATEAIVTLGCVQGAYQGFSLAYRVPRGAPAKAVPLRLPWPKFTPADEGSAYGYTEGGYASETANFSTRGKGRGIGDCGLAADWTWTGREWVLTGMSRQERCGGESPEWPTLYRAKVVPARR